MKQLQNGIYTFNTGERNWGEEVNQNFEALDNLISGVAGNNDKIELLSEKIQTNADNFEQTKDDLIDNINNTKNGLQDQIDILNNNILTLKYRVDNMDISVDSVEHAEEADVAKKLKKSLTIGNVSFNGEADTVVTIDGTPMQNSSNLINSNAVYDALELKQDKATTLNGYNITDAYTKSEIDDKISGLVNSAPETLDTLNELASALGNNPNFATTIATQIGNKANSNDVYTKTETDTLLSTKANTSDLATVATSGSYNDLSNKPTIPTVNNGTLTIQKNGTTVKTFTANSSTNVTCNIEIPTKVSDLTNDSNFLTSTDISNKADSATTLSGYGITDAYTKTQVDTKISDLVNSAPETLDTLNELASALGNDPNFATTIATQIGSKADNDGVVHTSGNETIGGAKTFTDNVTCASSLILNGYVCTIE